MPQIPTIQAQVNPFTGLPAARATPDAFGAGIGRALQGVGAQFDGAAQRLEQHEARRRNLDTQLTLAEARQDWTRTLVDRKASAPANPVGFTDQTLADYDRFTEEVVGRATSAEQADALRLGLMTLKTSIVSDSVNFEATQTAQHTRGRVEKTFGEYLNLIYEDPAQYEALVAQAETVANELGLRPADRDEYMANFRQNAAYNFFDARLSSAQSPEEIAVIEADLRQDKWAAELNPKQYSNLMDATIAGRKKAAELRAQLAKARFNSLTDRMDAVTDGVRIPPAEIALTDKAVVSSGDPALIQQWSEAKLAYETSVSAARMTPEALAEQRAKLALQQSNPGAMNILAAVMGVETSGGRNNVVSSAGAAGVMQVMPDTAREVAQELNDPSFPYGRDDAAVQAYLRTPGVGEAYGAQYLGKMLSRYRRNGQPDLEAALIAYHSGPGNADRWLEAGRDYSVLGPEGQQYVPKVVAALREQGVTAPVVFGERYFNAGNFQSKHYSWADLRNDRFASSVMDTGAVAVLDRVTDEFGRKLQMTSGYRSHEHNSNVSFAKRSRHTQGDAFDISVAGYSDAEKQRLVELFIQNGATGIGHYDNGSIHIDFRKQAGRGPGGLALWYNQNKPYTTGHPWFQAAVQNGLEARRGGMDNGSFVRYQAYGEVQAAMNAKLGKDPMSWAQNQGGMSITPVFGENGFDFGALPSRAEEARGVADHYGTDLSVFTNDEVQQIKRALDGATADEKLVLATEMVRGLGGAAGVALRQIGQEDALFAFAAGGVARDDAYRATAAKVFRGAEVMAQNKDAETMLGPIRDRTSTIESVGLPATDNPELTLGIRQAADAHYVASTPFGQEFDSRQYKKSVEAVMGSIRTAEMNGQNVVLPTGVEPEEFDTAIDHLTDDDVIRMSLDAAPPVDSFGDVLPAEDIRDEAFFQIVRENIYAVIMPDGTALSGADASQPFLLQMDADEIMRLSSRRDALSSAGSAFGGVVAP